MPRIAPPPPALPPLSKRCSLSLLSSLALSSKQPHQAVELTALQLFLVLFAGRRACIGERLTCMSIFLVLVAILQHFALKPHVTPEELDLSPETGFLTVAPKPFQLHVEPRWQV